MSFGKRLISFLLVVFLVFAFFAIPTITAEEAHLSVIRSIVNSLIPSNLCASMITGAIIDFLATYVIPAFAKNEPSEFAGNDAMDTEYDLEVI